MVKPPASVYLPFNAETPSVFRHAFIGNYISTAFMVLMVYDHVLTFDKELDWIWTLRWRLPKCLFLFNRYVMSPLIVLMVVVGLIFPISLPVCNMIVHLGPWVGVCSYATVEAILVLRVCALYGRKKLFVYLLIGLFALNTVAAIINTTFLTLEMRQIYYYEFLPGCWSYYSRNDIYSFWIPFTIFDGIVMLLTLYKVFPSRSNRSPTISLLARDSIVYFVIIFSVMVINEVTYRLGLNVGLMLPSGSIACMAVSRMMMNIRGLVMEDQDSTIYSSRPLKFTSMGGTDGTLQCEVLSNPAIDASDEVETGYKE